MLNSPACEPASPVTTRHHFFTRGSADQHYNLLEVAEGIPTLLALEHSVRVLHAAHKTFSGLVQINHTETQDLGSVLLLMEIAKALLDSVIDGFAASVDGS